MASVPVIVIDYSAEPGGGSGGNILGFADSRSPNPTRPCLAVVASNPELRATGRTEDEALSNLRASILARLPGGGLRKAAELRFDDLLAEEVMSS